MAGQTQIKNKRAAAKFQKELDEWKKIEVLDNQEIKLLSVTVKQVNRLIRDFQNIAKEKDFKKISPEFKRILKDFGKLKKDIFLLEGKAHEYYKHITRLYKLTHEINRFIKSTKNVEGHNYKASVNAVNAQVLYDTAFQDFSAWALIVEREKKLKQQIAKLDKSKPEKALISLGEIREFLRSFEQFAKADRRKVKNKVISKVSDAINHTGKGHVMHH